MTPEKEPFSRIVKTPSGKTYRIEFDREGCIGAAACVAADPKHWIMQADGKPNLHEATSEGHTQTKTITDAELEDSIRAAEVCPVRVIKIFDEEGNQIAP